MKSLLIKTCCVIVLALAPSELMAQTPQPAGANAAAPQPGRKITPGIDCRVQCSFTKQMVEGQPIDTRPTQLPGDHPLFPGQTRAPYHKTVNVKVTTLASDLDNPWAVAQLPDGRFLVTEKPGRIRILNKDGSSYDTITDLPPIYYRGQVGLLDVVLDPKYSTNHRIFFTYMRKIDANTCAMAVASATLNETKGELTNTKTIFQTAPYANSTAGNAGSRIAIDPKDGSLFVIIGDRSGGDPVWNVAQQTDNYLGKLIHITADGKPAPDNPKMGLPDIYNIGHRSEQGLAFAPDGKLWEDENGPRGGDHLNIMEPDKNYGWPVYTHGINYPGTLIGNGTVEAPRMEQPIYYWDPAIAPAGLAFYKGNLFPQWKNSVFVGALAGKALLRLELGKDGKVKNEEPLLTDINQRIRDVRVFKDGAVYVLTDGPNAKLLKLTPA
jgi:glucose/arabinose dehydrogenase